MFLVKKYIYIWVLILFIAGCSNDGLIEELDPDQELPADPGEEEEEEVGNTLEIYIPAEFSEMDFEDNQSTWSFQRSQESEHFVVFWGAEYGNNNPGSSDVPEQYRVDIDDLLEKSEQFYSLNIGDLGFAEVGLGNSNLDQYKMMIFLYYQEEWLATGSGYDDTIGALWVSPGTSQPVGATIAHEIGHSFQYQVFSDLANGHGFRYGFGGNGGNTFWEQTAQWQAFQAYPQQAFTSQDFQNYISNYYKHIHHEDYRYASYFIHYYWTSLHGKDFIGRLWREATEPEDPVEAYMRITNIDVTTLNDQIYDSATKFVTWDLDELRANGEDYIGTHKYNYTTLEDGSHMVTPEFAPQTTGYNVIPLNVPAADTDISISFTGLPNANGFNQVDAAVAGWRYGFVALLENGTRVYGEMNQGTTGIVEFTVPENCTNLWFVVTGAPTSYSKHGWDDDHTNDPQWPYKIHCEGTNILGIIDLPENGVPQDLDLTYDLSFPVDSLEYSGTYLNVDLQAIAHAFQLQPAEIAEKLGGDILFNAVESSGVLNPQTTANGYGHWFDPQGNVTGWGNNSVVFSEFDPSNFNFHIGQYPGAGQAGDSYTIRQALVYEYAPGENVQLTFIFNVLLE